MEHITKNPKFILAVMSKLKGFTLIELVMVIVLLGILAAVAIPKYIALQNDAKDAATQGTAGGVRGGISVWHSNALVKSLPGVWPVQLDTASGGDTTELFYSVLDIPIESGWTRGAGTAYTAPNERTFNYTSTDGTFE